MSEGISRVKSNEDEIFKKNYLVSPNYFKSEDLKNFVLNETRTYKDYKFSIRCNSNH